MRVRSFVYAAVPLALPLLVTNSWYAPLQQRAAQEMPPRLAIDYSALDTPAEPPPLRLRCLTVQAGDTLAGLFAAAGLDASSAHALATSFGSTFTARRIRPGDLVRAEYGEDDAIRRLSLVVSGWGQVEAERQGEGFEVRSLPATQTTSQVAVHGEIGSSLYTAIRASGESPQLATALADVFQWDVDFFRLRRGDWFSLIAEKRFVGREHAGYGPVMAARFHHNGNTYEAFRFERKDGSVGYYTREGRPLRKQFLKAPLKFSRITSGFTHRRFHPVLRTFRPHPGIDYGAPTGTPVMATADGTVVFAGFRGGEGNMIRLRHNARYETYYLHLSKFASGLRNGTRVQQGDVIGYVGATGLATGPHLDYRVTENGRWVNPLELKSVTADPLTGVELQAFRAAVSEQLARLQEPGSELLAAGN